MRGLSEATASESNCIAVRPCGMEAVSEPQHRTKVNLSAGSLAWVSVPVIMTPSIRSWPGSSRGGSGGTLLNLTPGDLYRSNTVHGRLNLLASVRWIGHYVCPRNQTTLANRPSAYAFLKTVSGVTRENHTFWQMDLFGDA